MSSMEEVLYQLKITEETITNLFEKRLGISLTRYRILQILLEEAPLYQTALQERLGIDRAAISRHLKILEEAAYIRRERNPDNQREILVYPTKKAQKDLIDSPPSQHVVVKRAMEHILTADQVEQFQQILTKLSAGLKDLSL
ncbi:TPA: MarR family winged helix-turn-helix transcriptional regulator [Streptococcus suis]